MAKIMDQHKVKDKEIVKGFKNVILFVAAIFGLGLVISNYALEHKLGLQDKSITINPYQRQLQDK